MTSPLDDWQFLIGTWIADPEQSPSSTPETEEKMIVTTYPAPTFFHMASEAWKDGKKIMDGLSIMFFDANSDQMKIKGFSAMGFVNNYNSFEISADKISFDSVNENVPESFIQNRFRYHLTKESDTQLRSTLEMAGPDGEFKKFWEAVFIKQ